MCSAHEGEHCFRVSIYNDNDLYLLQLYIPHELLTIADVNLPTSDALTRFEEIAWDGVDSINSAWDSCEVGCAIPVLENRLCGGTRANGLQVGT